MSKWHAVVHFNHAQVSLVYFKIIHPLFSQFIFYSIFLLLMLTFFLLLFIYFFNQNLEFNVRGLEQIGKKTEKERDPELLSSIPASI